MCGSGVGTVAWQTDSRDRGRFFGYSFWCGTSAPGKETRTYSSSICGGCLRKRDWYFQADVVEIRTDFSGKHSDGGLWAKRYHAICGQ